MLREELQLLQEPGSYVGEVVKVMGKKKVLVKVFITLFVQLHKHLAAAAYKTSKAVRSIVTNNFLTDPP
jgi:ATP-dependent 26S proteasome regulatory subunit